MMKKYFMGGFAMMALGLVVTSCNKRDIFNPYAEQEVKQEEFMQNFQNGVMDGKTIDQNQTWATTSTLNVSVTPRTDGTLKIYAANPIGNNVASLYTADVTAGTKTSFTVTKPADVSTLYAIISDGTGGYRDITSFDATSDASVNFVTTTSNRAARRAAPERPEQPSYDSTNPIRSLTEPTAPTAPTGMPTASNASVKITETEGNVTVEWGYQDGQTVYIAPNCTLTISQEWGKLAKGTKIYMGRGSRIIKTYGNVILEDGAVIYNDGGTIEGNVSLNKSTLWNKGTVQGTLSLSEGSTVWNEGTTTGGVTNLSKSTLWNKSTLAISNTIYYSTLWNEGTLNGGLNLEQGTLWNKGTVDVKASNVYYSDNGNGSQIYNSGTINNARDFQVGQNGTLWNVGTITATGTLKGNNTNSKIFNGEGHSISVGALELNNSGQYLWNDGTLTVTNAIKITNSSAVMVNNATISGGSYDVSAGGQFYNSTDGVVTITGETALTNSNAVWVNDGTYTSGSFKVSAGGNQVFNNCRLTVNNKFSMGNNDGSRFVLQGDASVVCDDFDWNGDNYFWMGANSLLLVKKTFKSNNNNDDGKGFHQYGDNFAVISAKAITTDNVNGQGRICLYGKIYVDADSMFELKYVSGISKNNYVKGEDVVIYNKQFTSPVPTSWATPTTCRPAYVPGTPNPEVVEYYYYAFEDLGTTDDFDFNDVVLRVSAPVNNMSTVELMAAGGTMATSVTYGTGDTKQTLCSEVHNAFQAASNSIMVNTHASGGLDGKSAVSLGTINVAGKDMSDLPLGINATGNGGQQVAVVRSSVQNQGKAPLVIVACGYPSGANAGKWFWPTERTNISTAYEGFGAWGSNVSNNQTWYQSYTNENVYKY